MKKLSKEERKRRKKEYLEADPIYRELKRNPQSLSLNEIINFPNSEVEWLIVREVLTRIPDGFRKEKEALLKLPKPVTRLFATWLLEADILNGGFAQFFFNQQPLIWELAIEAYEMFQMPEWKKSVEKAVFKHLKGKDNFIKEEKIFDNVFSQAQPLKAAYIKSHPNDFQILDA